jgi:hypothetical protein
MDPLTLGLFAAGTAGTQFLGGLFGANKKRDQARRAAKAQNRANLMADQQRMRMHNFQENERMRMHNYKVDAYKRFIPRAFDRANLAYQDNNAGLTELIDQYQFQGQDRMARDVASRGALAARGITGRGAMMQDVAQSAALGRGDALMADNLMRARYGVDRANMKIRQQLTDSLQQAYNQVGYTPRRAPAPMATPQVSPAYNNNDYTNDLIGSAFGAVSSGLGMFMGGGGLGGLKTPKPNPNPGWGPNSIPYAPS